MTSIDGRILFARHRLGVQDKPCDIFHGMNQRITHIVILTFLTGPPCIIRMPIYAQSQRITAPH